MPVAALGKGLPAAWTGSPDLVRGELVRSGRRVVVLDDDPTGTQTVRDVPVVTEWSVETLRWALVQASPLLFVLTNSRSMSEHDAMGVARDVARSALSAAADVGVDVSFVSRGDSTLRGHFPAEVDALQRAGAPADALLVVPAYLEAGRLTRDGVHYVVQRDQATPVGETEFARDATFGYRSSELAAWVEERSGRRWARERIPVLTVGELRSQPAEALAVRLIEVTGGRPVIADALAPGDLDVLARAVVLAQGQGHRLLVRCAPSFVRALGGLPASVPLGPAELAAAMDPRCGPHGLVVVGSHTALTTRQLESARGLGFAADVELDVVDARAGRVDPAAVAGALTRGLQHGDVLLRTSRQVLSGVDGATSLEIANLVAATVVDVVRRTVAAGSPRWVVAKGGITSSDVAVHALGLSRAWVLGQMLPGLVSVWTAAPRPRLTDPRPLCVIFPGNVGDHGTLADVVQRLRDAPADLTGPVEMLR